jgi:DNA-binding XRE family transcriptional regulator
MEVSPEFVRRIKEVRDRKQFSRERFARLAEVSSITILRIEDGTTKAVRDKTFKRIQKAIETIEAT